MNLAGKIINNCYIIKEKISEDSISTTWLAFSMFSVKNFLIRIFRRSKLKITNNNLDKLKKDIFDSDKIENENIFNILEIGKYDNKIFTLIEITEGESLFDYIMTNESLDPNTAIRIFIKLVEFCKISHDKNQVYGYLTCNDIWVDSFFEKIHRTQILNYKYDLIKKYFPINIFNNIKTQLAPEIINKKIKIDPSTDLYSIGTIFYLMLTGDFKFHKKKKNDLKKSLDKIKFEDKKSRLKFINIILKLLSKKKKERYKNISLLMKDMDFLKLKKEYDEIKSIKDKSYQSGQDEYDLLFAERRKYFENLEDERRKRFYSKKIEKKSYEYNEKKRKSNIFLELNQSVFERRRELFINEQKNRWNYLKETHFKREEHYETVINKTREYFSQVSKREVSDTHYFEEHKKYFDDLTEQMKEYADALKNENIEYFNSLSSKKEELADKYNSNDTIRYLEDQTKEACENLKELTNESLNYFINLTNEAKKYLKENLPESTEEMNMKYREREEYIKDLVDETINYYSKIEQESNRHYKKILNESKNYLKKRQKKEKRQKRKKEKSQFKDKEFFFNSFFITREKKYGFIRTLYKRLIKSKGNLCFIDTVSNPDAQEYITDFKKKINEDKIKIINIKCDSETKDKSFFITKNIFKYYLDSYNNLNEERKQKIEQFIILSNKNKILKTSNINNTNEYLNFLVNLKKDDKKKYDLNYYYKFISTALCRLSNYIKPLLLIIQDMEHIDNESMLTIGFISNMIKNSSVLILCLYDYDKAENNNELRKLTG